MESPGKTLWGSLSTVCFYPLYSQAVICTCPAPPTAARSLEDVPRYGPAAQASLLNGSWCVRSFAALLVTALVDLCGVLHIGRPPDARPAVCCCSLRSLERCPVLVSSAKSLDYQCSQTNV